MALFYFARLRGYFGENLHIQSTPLNLNRKYGKSLFELHDDSKFQDTVLGVFVSRGSIRIRRVFHLTWSNYAELTVLFITTTRNMQLIEPSCPSVCLFPSHRGLFLCHLYLDHLTDRGELCFVGLMHASSLPKI